MRHQPRPVYLTVMVTQPDKVSPFTRAEVLRMQNLSLPVKPAAGV
jgi:hypothetical protein